MLLPALVLIALCGIVCVGLFRLRYGWSQDRWLQAIRFAPKEPVGPDALFGYLLSANLALLEHDNFNQLASALPHDRIRAILAAHWNIDSAATCGATLFGKLRSLGRASPDEAAAFSAWAAGTTAITPAFAALHDVCRFLSLDAQVAKPHRLAGHAFSLAAWDIQQVAYIARLGVAVGFVSRDIAEDVLDELKLHARLACRSWSDFSLSMLVGMGMHSPVDAFDVGGWNEFARSHGVLLESHATLLRFASPWGEVAAHRSAAVAAQPASAASTSRAIDAGVSSGA